MCCVTDELGNFGCNEGFRRLLCLLFLKGVLKCEGMFLGKGFLK